MDFSGLSMTEWTALGSLLVGVVVLVWNVSLGNRQEVKSDKNLCELEGSMEKGLRKLDSKTNAVDKSVGYLVGFLDGVGITKEKKTEGSS